MKYEAYTDVKFNTDYSKFDFISEGCNGKIPKRVQILPMPIPNVYNLSFGDIKENGELDDLTISNNGDRNKILATIVKVVVEYSYKFPNRYIFFQGSTEQRTRLYRIAVSLNLEELSEIFEIYADITGNLDLVRFQKGLDIKAFVIKRKIIRFVI
jgi:hypothetical protein